MSGNKRSDIRQSVLASITGGLTAKRPEGGGNAAPRVKAFIATAGERVTEGLAAKVERLEAERGAGGVVLRIDPKRINRTNFANRDGRSLDASDPDMKDLIAKIQAHGQLEPIRVRPAPHGSQVEYEIVYGHRRHAACLVLDAMTEGGWPVLALLDAKATDAKDHVLKMYEENAARKDLSPYETGAMFSNWLSEKVFSSQGEIAKATGVSDATVSHYIRLHELPAAVIAAFGDPRLISLRWMQELSRVLKENRGAVIECAERLAKLDGRPPAEVVLRNLLAAASGERPRPAATREESVKIQGKVALKLSRKEGRLTLKVGKMIDKSLQRELAEEVKEFATNWLTKRLRAK
jgi:ParB family transcriptional regulator, chromosome partitioning protein